MKKHFLFLLLLIDPAYACACGPSIEVIIASITIFGVWHAFPIIVIRRLFVPGKRFYWVMASILLIPVSWVVVGVIGSYFNEFFIAVLGQFIIQFSFLYIAWRKSKELEVSGNGSGAV